MIESPTLVANLWDVTDKDIDRFAMHLLDDWHVTSQVRLDTEILQQVFISQLCHMKDERFESLKSKCRWDTAY